MPHIGGVTVPQCEVRQPFVECILVCHNPRMWGFQILHAVDTTINAKTKTYAPNCSHPPTKRYLSTWHAITQEFDLRHNTIQQNLIIRVYNKIKVTRTSDFYGTNHNLWERIIYHGEFVLETYDICASCMS